MTFSKEEAIKAQQKEVERIGIEFAPTSGKCWHCGHNIYEPISIKGKLFGISVEEASADIITRCPHCDCSFCD